MSEQATIAKAIRRDLKDLNIDAKVKSFKSCGSRCVRVSTKDIDTEWTEAEASKIGGVAKFYELTGVRGTPIMGINVCSQEFHLK